MEATDPAILRGFGALRRMAITVTAKALWQLTGFKQPDGTIETMKAEPFTGIGLAARPPNGGRPEAIVVMVGGASSPMIIAVRDEKTRAAIAGALGVDETMLFNSKAVVYVKADGSIEARSAGGAAHALATKADIDALAAYVDKQFSSPGHTHTVDVAHAVTLLTTQSAVGGSSATPAAAGTQKLKGE